MPHLSRRALLAGGAALLAGCNAADPYDGDPDAANVTAAPVPKSGPERLAAIDERDLPAFEPPVLVSERHLASRLDRLESTVETVETVEAALSGTASPTAATATTTAATTTVADGNATATATGTTTVEHDGGARGPSGHRRDERQAAREQARRTRSEARAFLEDVRDEESERSGRPGFDSRRRNRLRRANHLISNLTESLWWLRLAYGRAERGDVPDPSAVEPRARSFRSSLTVRCDGSGRAFLYLSRVEQSLSECLAQIAEWREHRARDARDGKGDDHEGRETTRARQETTAVGNYVTASLSFADAERYYATYEARLGDARPCGEPLPGTADALRSRLTDRHRALSERAPPRTTRGNEVGGTGPESGFVAAVRQRFVLGDDLYRRATEEVREYREEGWTVLPVTKLGTYLLWYRATATVLDRLPADPVDGDERAELVAATHDAAVERFERAVDAADGDLLARSYLRYASSYLRRGNEVVERYGTNEVERSDDRHALVEACTSFLRAYGVAVQARPTARLVRGGESD